MQAPRIVRLAVVLAVSASGLMGNPAASANDAESNLLANGGFELIGKLGKSGLSRELKNGMTFEDADPSLPMRWSWRNKGPVKMGITENAPHGGKRALNLKCPQGDITLSMSFVEVVPKAAYTFGAWAKGSGNAEVILYGCANEGPKELARVKLEPADGWKQAGKPVTIPGDIRTVRLDLAVSQAADVTLDDVFFSADLAQPYDADAVLTTKPKRDKHTLAFVDFDGQGECILENGASLVDGGRFGKGLRLEKTPSSSASVLLNLKKMPEEGTLEYWFAPDGSAPERNYVFSMLMAGDQDLLRLWANTGDFVDTLWRTSEGEWDNYNKNEVQIHGGMLHDWLRPGQWHHVAIAWDKEAVRVYFDGVLAGYSTEKPLPFFNTASILKLGPHYAQDSWAGMIDEVRLSDVRRYGPFVPEGSAWIPLVAAAAKTPAPVTGAVVDNPGFTALPRPINYATPLAPANGSKAVVVYGKEAPWTKQAAEAVQKALQDWSGVKLELADDRTVTSEETWLLNDAFRKTPMIVLGNAQDNRVMHALGTRYLLQSNRTWPGGDRYIIRSVFEPFIAGVNYVILEASNDAGMDGAVAKFAELLASFSADAKATATIPPRVRVVAGGKDKWVPYLHTLPEWNPPLPPEMTNDLSRRVSELALSYKGTPPTAGWGITRGTHYPSVCGYMMGGENWSREQRLTPALDDGTLRAAAAMCLLGCRAAGGRAYPAYDHYGAATYLVWLRAIFQTGVLTDKELNEFENCITLSAADPGDYVFEHIGNGDGIVGGIHSGRHSGACLLTMIEELDYVLNHCRIDDRTRKEVQRRYDGAMKTAARYVRSFRGNEDDSCLGEDTVLQFYALLYEGLMENVRNGMLRHSADMYIMTTDNIPHMYWQDPYISRCYAGLSGFSSQEMGMLRWWLGGSLVIAAAFYYDDPQYRWFVRNRNLPAGSEGAYAYGMHSPYDAVGAVEEPTRYYGVHALPFDERIYSVLSSPQAPGRNEAQLRLPPEPLDKAIDRVAFRDGFEIKDAYLFLAGSQNMGFPYPAQNNSIARYTDLGDIWLYANTFDGTTWSRSVVNSSTGGSYIPRAGCLLEALANLGDVSMVSSKERDSGGADWTRTIVHWKGHYFTVLDRMEARQDDPATSAGDSAAAREYTFVCRWRSLPLAALANGVWTARAQGGNTLRIQSAEDVVQTSEVWPCDGSASPSVLQQYKQARLAKGQEETYENLVYVSGPERPDEFEARQASPRAMMVKGRTKDGDHLALIGTGGNIPLANFQTDAAIYHVTGDQLRLAGVTTLRANVGDSPREILWVQQPVNALVDCRTGKAEIEVAGDKPVQAKTGPTWGALQPGRQTVTLAEADVLPRPAGLLESLWPQCRAPSGKAPETDTASAAVFEVKSATAPLQRPLERLTTATVTSTPPPGLTGTDARIHAWNNTDKLEILLTFPRPAEIGCLRLIGPNNWAAVRSGPQNGKFYEAGDFTFSLVLSDDNFQKDVRTMDSPHVTFEETAHMIAGHYVLMRYPTWRIEVGATARQFKLLPRATTKERGALNMMDDLEVYGKHVDQLQAKAFAADINGDGANELVVGTSQKELAAYDAEGHRLWDHTYDADIHDMSVADLDEDGKAEVLVYLTTEKLHRVNSDGTERPVGDVNTVCERGVNIISIGAWGPDGPAKKEVLLWSGEPSGFRVLADGTVKPMKSCAPQGSARLVNQYPNEPEALAAMFSWELTIFSARRDAEGNYIRLGSKNVTGGNSGNEASPPGVLRQFCCVLPVEAGGVKRLVGAVASGLNCFPITAFVKGVQQDGWKFNTGGPSGAALLAEDLDGDGAPAILYARQDGFVNVFKLADGHEVGRLNTGEPILGMCLLKTRSGKPCLAVGTKFGVHLFGADLKLIGKNTFATPAASFAGPGGKDHDRAFAVGTDGQVTVLMLK